MKKKPKQLLTTSQQMPRQTPSSASPSQPPHTSIQFYCQASRHRVWNIPWDSWGHCPSSVPSQLLVYSQPSHWLGSVRRSKGLEVV